MERAGLRKDPSSGGRVIQRVALAAAALLAALALFLVPAAPDERAYPTAVFDSIPIGDGTLARYEWGGWLIWRARNKAPEAEAATS